MAEFDVSAALRFERLRLIGRLYTKNQSRFPKNVEYGDIVKGLPIESGKDQVTPENHPLIVVKRFFSGPLPARRHMKISHTSKRIISFFYNRRKELLSKQLWTTVVRVVTARFNIWERVSKGEFVHNLTVIQSRPWNLHVELTNLCNSNCIFCAYQYQTRPIAFMSDAIYKKALDDYCAIGGGDLMLEVIVGDPLVDTRFIQRVRQARQRKEIASIDTTTNLIALREHQIKELIESGISKIQISTGPFREDLYSQIYRNKWYKSVLKNVKALLEQNESLRGPVEIKIAFRSNLSMKETLSLPDYRLIANLPHKVEFNTDFDTWTAEITPQQLLDGMHIRPPSNLEREPCIWLYDGPIIFANGDVGLCGCRDFNANSELIAGNIMEKPLIEIWQSENVMGLRKRFYDGNFPKICKKCTTYANLDMFRTKYGSTRAQLTDERIRKSGILRQ